jgi:hypothetical protein
MIIILYDVSPCNSVEAATTLQESAASVFYPEDGEGRIHPKHWYLIMKVQGVASSGKVPACLSDFYKA